MLLYIERNGGGFNLDKCCFIIDLNKKELKQIPNKNRNKNEILEEIETFKKIENKDTFSFDTPYLLKGANTVKLSNDFKISFKSQNTVYLINNNKIRKIYEYKDTIIAPSNENMCQEIERLLFVCGTRRAPMCL